MKEAHLRQLIGAEALEAPPVFGDLGCPGVSIAQFKRDNRAPVFVGKWNRWILARTTRDNPSTVDLARSLRAVLVQWFKPWSNVGDLVATYEVDDQGRAAGKVTSRHANADLVYIRRAYQQAPILTAAQVAKMPDGRPARRRDVEPLITMSGDTPPIFLLVEFVWRGTTPNQSLPWPVHRAQMLNPWCPVKADWALWDVLPPADETPPPERTGAEKMTAQVIESATRGARQALGIDPGGLLLAGGLGLGFYLLLTQGGR